MYYYSKHTGFVFLHYESEETINGFISKLIDNQYKIENNLPKNDLYRININHKIDRIQKQIIFVQDNLVKYQNLTLREKEIINLLAKGNNNPTIADQLFISRSTVEQHRKNINRKLDVKSISQLMQFIYAFDLI